MLATFPILYSFEILVPTLFRLVLATFLVFQTWCLFSEYQHSVIRKTLRDIFSEDWVDALRVLIGVLRISASILFLIGAFTQIAALVTAILFALRMASHTYREELMSTDLLLILISLSLLFLGPGAFALDYPF